MMILRKKSKTAIEPLLTGAKVYLLAKSRQPKPAGNNGVSYSLRGNGSGDHYDVQLLRSAMARPITDASAGEVLSALERIQNDSFGRKILDHIAASGLRPARVYKAAGVDRRLYSRIILHLHLADIVRDGDRYRLEIVEQKTGKRRIFTVPLVIQQYIENYCLRNGIKQNELIFPITERAIQKQIKLVCEYLGYEGISTHSFRKWYATEIYKNNGFDIARATTFAAQ